MKFLAIILPLICIPTLLLAGGSVGGSGGITDFAIDHLETIDVEAISRTELIDIIDLKPTENDPVRLKTKKRSLLIEKTPVTAELPKALDATDEKTLQPVILIVE